MAVILLIISSWNAICFWFSQCEHLGSYSADWKSSSSSCVDVDLDSDRVFVDSDESM